MLVLTRKRDEKIIIGNITITLIDIKKGNARLGFEAPKDVEIWREEVYEQRKNNGKGVQTKP